MCIFFNLHQTAIIIKNKSESFQRVTFCHFQFFFPFQQCIGISSYSSLCVSSDLQSQLMSNYSNSIAVLLTEVLKFPSLNIFAFKLRHLTLEIKTLLVQHLASALTHFLLWSRQAGVTSDAMPVPWLVTSHFRKEQASRFGLCQHNPQENISYIVSL